MRMFGAGCLEFARALAVLALFFVGVAHAPAFADGGTAFAGIATSSFCGGAPSDPHSHPDCPACRIAGGTDLPTPCPAIGRAFLSAKVAFSRIAPTAQQNADAVLPQPRGPPAA